jgi:SAM-dependent methyltransferase
VSRLEPADHPPPSELRYVDAQFLPSLPGVETTAVLGWKSTNANPAAAKMPSCHCEGTDRHFTPRRARQDLATYRRRGPTGTARLILKGLGEAGVTAETLLDVGAGIGVLHHELLERGVQRAVHLEVASAFLEAAKEETVLRGHEGLVRFQQGDVVSLASEVAVADLVTLDRVVCCYPDVEALITVSAQKARRYYALSYPRDRWYIRSRVWLQNYRRQRTGDPFRFFVHPVARMRSLILAGGFEVRCSCSTLNWDVLICGRR